MTRNTPRLAIFNTILALNGIGCGPPSDQTLIAEFHRGRSDYDTLLSMFRAESGLGRIAYDFTRPTNYFSGARLREFPPVSSTRLAEYRELFNRLSLSGGIEGYDQKHMIYFWRYGEGFGAGLGGGGKGLAFSDSLPPDRPTADGCATPLDDCWQFRPIGGGWFVLEEHHN